MLAAHMLGLPPLGPPRTTLPLPPSPTHRATTPSEAAVALRRVLETTLEKMLGERRRVAVLAGGGLDSGGLLALVVQWARLHKREAFAVALDFESPGDDRPHARALEAHLRCEMVRVKPEDAAHRFSLFTHGVANLPFAWPTAPMEVEMLACARANGAECVLTGVGGDHLFDGDPSSLADVAAHGNILQAALSARRLGGFFRPRAPTFTWVVRPNLARLQPRWLRLARARRQPVSLPPWAGPRLAQFARGAMQRDLTRSLVRKRNAQERFDSAWTDPAYDAIISLRQQQKVASGIECHDPFMHPNVIACVTSFEPSWLLYRDVRRGLFREAIRGLVPETVRTREDKALFEQAAMRFLEALGGVEALRPFASVTHLTRLGLIEPKAFGEAFEAFAAAPLGSDGFDTLWMPLGVEAFLRTLDTETERGIPNG